MPHHTALTKLYHWISIFVKECRSTVFNWAFDMDDRIDAAVMLSDQSSGWMVDCNQTRKGLYMQTVSHGCNRGRADICSHLSTSTGPIRSLVPLQAEVMCDPDHATGTYIFREMQTRASHQYHSISLSTAESARVSLMQHGINNQINYQMVSPVIKTF